MGRGGPERKHSGEKVHRPVVTKKKTPYDPELGATGALFFVTTIIMAARRPFGKGLKGA